MIAPDPFLTYTDAGKVAGVSRTTIAKWIDSGVLNSATMPGSNRRRIRQSTLLAFLDSLEQEAKVSQLSQPLKMLGDGQD